MTLPVSDVRSNPNDQIASAARAIGQSKDRALVFDEIHSGRSRIKTVTTIALATDLSRKRVLEEGKRLVHKQIIKQTTRDGDIAYERDAFYYANKRKILKFAQSPKKLSRFPTKYSPRSQPVTIKVSIPLALVKAEQITIDEIESFKKVRKVTTTATTLTIRETVFKHGIQRIIAEPGRFTDWGGETSDLFTTRLRLEGKRVPAAFAFKGRGTRGLLTPARLGKNGDQIQRLFNEDATVFLVQYGEQISPSVIQQMAAFAQMRSVTTSRIIRYGVIDGRDSARLVAAHPAAFRGSARTKR